MTFASSIYKLYETIDSQIVKMLAQQISVPQQVPQSAKSVNFNLKCGKCNTESKIQANLGRPEPLKPGFLPFPGDNKFACPSCGAECDLTQTRRQIEADSGKRVV